MQELDNMLGENISFFYLLKTVKIYRTNVQQEEDRLRQKKVRRSSKKETFKNEEVVCKVQTF